MADGLEFKIQGLDPLKEKLTAVDAAVRGPSGRTALRKAAYVLRDKARENASRVDDPQTKEAINKNIVAAFGAKRYKATGDLSFRIGVLGGAKSRKKLRSGEDRNSGNPGGDTFYWRFVEMGTQRVAARPFLRNVGDQVGQQAVDTFIEAFGAVLDRAIKRGSA